MTSPDKSGITVGTRSYTTHWDTIQDQNGKIENMSEYLHTVFSLL